MIFKKRHAPPGASPGTLIISPKARPTRIRVMQFNADSLVEKDITVDELTQYLSDHTITWVDVHGLKDEGILRRLSEIFGIHPLALEDVVHTPQRPKAEFYEQHIFFITRMAYMEREHDAEVEQLSMFIGKNYVLTFQNYTTGNLEPVRTRIRGGKGPIRKTGADYVAYAIIDTVLDKYYPILEDLGEEIESIEHLTIAKPDQKTLQRIYHVKRELLDLRRAVWPQRDAISSLMRDESPFISDTVRIYLRDCYDHIIQLMDVIDTYREVSSNLMDIYLSTLSNKTNEVMKVLTIMASIFIPLTFIVGIYGMNFEYMPELTWKWGYPAVWIVMIVLSGGMLLNFKRRGWLNGSQKESAKSDAGVPGSHHASRPKSTSPHNPSSQGSA
jgi:magnesium transporter